MQKPKKGTEIVCGVCGTTLVVTAEEAAALEDVVCCEKPMDVRSGSRGKTKPQPKKNSQKGTKR